MARVLIIDDSPTEVHQLKLMLERNSHTVLTANNAVDGIALCNKEKLDAVLMDIVMPGLNGFQATRQLAKNPLTQHIPVVIITTKDQETDKIWGIRQGAREFLAKPVTEKMLLTVMDRVLAVETEI
ncbi:MAG: response regulator [Endozoicomonas sp. (ex Botrylloides leachii)]|nr:response regulator [Endozoicomonas sp. (ex Botrylloides leachii)]